MFFIATMFCTGRIEYGKPAGSRINVIFGVPQISHYGNVEVAQELFQHACSTYSLIDTHGYDPDNTMPNAHFAANGIEKVFGGNHVKY